MESGGNAAADGSLKTPSGPKRPKEPETVTPAVLHRPDGEERTSSGDAAAAASAYDVIMPKIRQPNEKDIIAKFQFKDLDVIEGEPNYGSITRAHKQTIKNALKVKSIFGGGRLDTSEW